MKYYIGTSGWSYKHWIEKFYPKELKPTDWIKFYSERFNTSELNMSFYRFPSEKILKKWKNILPEDFSLTLKANRSITHIKKLTNANEILNNFYSVSQVLNKKLGCILFQLPPSYDFNERNFNKLKDFIKILDKKFINVFEFRDKNWWNHEVYELLKKNNCIFCILSGLGLPDDFIQTSDVIYIRFHGPSNAYSSNYSDQELEEWAMKIKSNCKNCKEVYCYFNNDLNAYSVFNALKLKEILKN